MSMESNKSIKIPDTHYVGFQKRSGDEVPLGFMTPDGTDVAATKRKATVDKWAGGRGYSSAKQATLPAKTLDNKPLVGFKMGKNISYGSGWDSRSDTWRIEDPRGFQLEITSGNLQKILELCTIERCEIQEPCIWGRLGNANVLIPAESEIYKNAAKNTKRMSKKGSVRDAMIGDKLIMKNGDEYIYLGKMMVFGFRKLSENTDESDSSGYYNRHTRWISERVYETLNARPHHAIAKFGDLEKPETFSAKTLVSVELKDSLTISEIVAYKTGFTQDFVCDMVNEWMYTPHTSGGSYDPRRPSAPNKTTANEAVILQVTPTAIDAASFHHETVWVSYGNWDDFIADTDLKKAVVGSGYYTRGVIVHNRDKSLIGWYNTFEDSKLQMGLRPNNTSVVRPGSTYKEECEVRRIVEEFAKRPIEASIVPEYFYSNSQSYWHRQTFNYVSLDMSGLRNDEIFISKLFGKFTSFSGKQYQNDYTNTFC